MTALAVILAFIGGICTGGLALYSVFQFVLTTPEIAKELISKTHKAIGLGEWFSLQGDNLKMQCPKCKHFELSDSARHNHNHE